MSEIVIPAKEHDRVEELAGGSLSVRLREANKT
jgi:hypothetical protein